MHHFLPTGISGTRARTIWTIVTRIKKILSSVLRARMISLIKEIFFRLGLRKGPHLQIWINIIYLITISVKFYDRIWIFREVFNIAQGQSRRIGRIWINQKISHLRSDRKVEARNWCLQKRWIMMVKVWSILNALQTNQKLSHQQNAIKWNCQQKLSRNSIKVSLSLSRNSD